MIGIVKKEVDQMENDYRNGNWWYDLKFDDTEESPFVGIISAIADKKYMIGNEAAMFLPDEYITRGTFASVIRNILTNNKTLNFKDTREYDNQFTDIDDL